MPLFTPPAETAAPKQQNLPEKFIVISADFIPCKNHVASSTAERSIPKLVEKISMKITREAEQPDKAFFQTYLFRQHKPMQNFPLF